VPDGDFVRRQQTEYFNAQTYLVFLDGDLLPISTAATIGSI
jgi:hypothetical protein